MDNTFSNLVANSKAYFECKRSLKRAESDLNDLVLMAKQLNINTEERTEIDYVVRKQKRGIQPLKKKLDDTLKELDKILGWKVGRSEKILAEIDESH